MLEQDRRECEDVTSSRPPEGRDEQPQALNRILLASEGRPISKAALAEVVRLLGSSRQRSVYVLVIARIYGTALGLQTPGLLPTKSEWEEKQRIATAAVRQLRRKGIDAEGAVVGSRQAGRRICMAAREQRCEAIVMGADRNRNRLLAELSWSQEPQRVRRRAAVPVVLVGQD